MLYTWGHTWGKSSTASSSGSVPLHQSYPGRSGEQPGPCPDHTYPLVTDTSESLQGNLSTQRSNLVECPGKHRALPGGTLWNQELGLSAKKFSAAHHFDLCQFSCLNSGTLGLALGDLSAEYVRFQALDQYMDLEVVLPA